MRLSPIALFAASLLAAPALGQESGLYDPAIQRAAPDGIVRLYGAGGPHTAFQKVADAWMAETGKKVEITAGPEKTWSAKAQADADIIWGTSEQSMTAFLEAYPDGGPHLQNPMPVGLLEPEDISAAVLYLVSDAAQYVTGVAFPVDAGFCNKL